MKRTVKSCANCNKIFILYINSINGEYCKRCRTMKQKISELKLSDYMQVKYRYDISKR